ncbi:MAG: peptidoglycan-binding protein, partial [Clostridia bacterium]|nr:peptidoglycan-binding protein [Clostridia bacterium]
MKSRAAKLTLLLFFLLVLALALTGCYVPPDELSDDGRSPSGNVSIPFDTVPATAEPTEEATPSPSPDPNATVNWDGWGSNAVTTSLTPLTPGPGVSPSVDPLATVSVAPLRTIAVITASPSPTPTAAPTAIKKGASGSTVKSIQQRLKALGYYTGTVDGSFGTGTETAVKAFQKANGLTVDGKVGTLTLKKLNSSSAVKAPAKATATPKKTTKPTATPKKTAKPTPKVTATPKPTSRPDTDDYLRIGSSGKAVRQLQERLISLGWLAGKADGDYGTATEAAVKAFQSAGHLGSDGVAGPSTLSLLYSTRAPKTTSASASIGESLKEGSEGQAVRALQKRLKELGFYTGAVDGSYGKETTAAVMSFQVSRGLKADGVAGSGTLSALYSSKATATPKPTATPDKSSGRNTSVKASSTGYVTLEFGSYGDQVRNLQSKLKQLGYYTGSVDGKFGNDTESAVRSFQQSHHLTVDGKAGPATQRALYSTSSGKATYSTLRPGDTGSAVTNLQYTLYELGYYDGSVDGI